ncbi:transmembrane protein 120B isoform X11 [Macaca fascicularis]|uniref:transmembrane protein 120B isoform X11 n=1 Tax=Macaca fascicularis TaxID=9541 RepID=UPI003D158E72
MSGQLERCEREWHELEGEFQELQETHRIYKQKLEELAALQTLCSSSISKQKKHLKDLKLTLQRCKRHTSQEEAELVQQMAANIKERQDVFFDMEAYLPKKNGVTDEVFNFLLVWYYCTLTIRESILISNGSRIKGWWVSHHYVSTFLSGVMLTWPNGPIYQKFRNQFLAFSIFQKGFQSWMWRGLTFLLPFLFCGHFWQLYNAVTLFELSSHEECREWQVFVLALTFLILFLGNFLTTLKVVHAKLQKNRGKTKQP